MDERSGRELPLFAAILFAMLVAVSGCSTSSTKARIDLSQTHFETPEAMGKSRHWVGIRAAASNSTIVAFTPGATTNKKMDSHRLDVQEDGGANPADMVFVDVGGKYGVADQVDLGIEGDSRGFMWAKAKWQLLGKPESIAGEGDTSVAIAARVGVIDISEEKGGACALCASYNRDKVEVGNTLFDIGLLGGYRLNTSLLSYAGINYQQINHDANSVHAVYDNNDVLLSRSELSWQGKTCTSSILVGLMIRPDLAKNTRVFFEVSRAMTTTEEKTLNATYGGMQITAGW